MLAVILVWEKAERTFWQGGGSKMMERLSCRDPNVVVWVKEAGRVRLMFNLQVCTMEV